LHTAPWLSIVKKGESNMQRVIDKETGEFFKDTYYNKSTDEIKTIQYEHFDYVISEINGKIELMYFPDGYVVPKHVAVDEDMMNNCYTAPELGSLLGSSKFKSENGIAVPISEDSTIMDLQKTFNRGSARAKKNFYNYALANKWQYFCTYTFNREDVRNDKDLLFQSWNNFMKALRKKNPDLKGIAVYESFEKGGYHIHALLANCILTLRPSISPNTGDFIYSSKYQNQVFNCLDWQAGFNTVVCINPDSNNVQVVNYLGSYMTKESPAPYRCKRYFHTRNLDCRNVYCGKFNKPTDGDKFPENMFEIIEYMKKAQTEFTLPKAIFKYKLTEYKKKNGIIIYRNY